ncbi:MAG: von Willebrand factor, type [Chthonomonadaceae bacterium]|nr:von Willebrand factor, type [Chthonomonadaceae bacterium]
MGSTDGFVFSSVKVVDHGDDALRFNIVILGDGYQAAELNKFHNDVDDFVNTLRATAPYNDVWCALNIYRVDIVSTDSGADDPGACGDGSAGSGAARNTFLDATFCGDGNIRRLLTCNNTLAIATAHSVVAHPSMTMVIVNTSEYGGSGGDVATFSTAPDAAQIGIHEMGHTAFGFADEYEYFSGCDSGETGHDTHPAADPFKPNVTTNTNPATIKWASLLTHAADGLPTTHNADCSKCDSQGNPKAANYVGAYEGAHYFHCGCFRPSFDCKMRKLANGFCAVCQQVIRDTMQPHLPDATPLLMTPNIVFSNIPEGVGGVGVTTFRAIVFELDACMAASRHLRFTAGPTGGFTAPLGTSADLTTVSGGAIVQARLWIGYTSTTAGATATGSVTVHCDQTGQNWVIPITANTVARPKSAIALVFDHSGSMVEDAGDGIRKVDKLREAANIFLTAMLPGDGVSVTRFDDTSQILMNVTDVGPVTVGAGRLAAGSHLGAEIDPAGLTSIGAGVVNGKATLDAAQAAGTPHYDNTAIVVLTDGVENTAPLLVDVRSSLTANTFAVGLGKAENISIAALSALTQAHNGYVLITGAITSDQAARLNKYFLQILAGATNANIVLDPHGELTAGAEHRIPFWVSESDIGLDVFLLSPAPFLADFQLETPDGNRITVASTGSGNIQFVPGARSSFYRLSLPALFADASGSHGGRWFVVLKLARGGRQTGVAVSGSVGKGVLPYDVVVHCYSNLNFRAYLTQSGFEPGANAKLTATLKEYDVPVDSRAAVWAEVTRPDGSVFAVAMPQAEPGRFEGGFVCSLSGLYTARVRANGTSFYGSPFQREQTLSAAVYPGGGKSDGTGGPQDNGSSDGHPGSGSGGQGGKPGGPCGCSDPFWCQLVQCLLGGEVLSPQLFATLKKQGFNLEALLRCLERHCHPADRKSVSALTPEAIQRIADAIAGELR